jgi:hypothetical protein
MRNAGPDANPRGEAGRFQMELIVSPQKKFRKVPSGIEIDFHGAVARKFPHPPWQADENPVSQNGMIRPPKWVLFALKSRGEKSPPETLPKRGVSPAPGHHKIGGGQSLHAVGDMELLLRHFLTSGRFLDI